VIQLSSNTVSLLRSFARTHHSSMAACILHYSTSVTEFMTARARRHISTTISDWSLMTGAHLRPHAGSLHALCYRTWCNDAIRGRLDLATS